jgi:prephenate dehydrogenase
MALDIKGLYPEATVYGVDTDEDHLRISFRSGRCRGANRKLVRCRFRNLSVPVDVALTLLPKVLDVIGENSIVLR